MAFAKKFEVEVTVPKGVKAGESFKVIVEAPELPTRSKGTLVGIAVADMTDEQLKRELVNAKSVLYKAEKRDADAALIETAKARVAAAEAEKAKRTPAGVQGSIPTGTIATSLDNVEAAKEADSQEPVVDELTAAEI